MTDTYFAELAQVAAEDYRDYESTERRRALFRVLASNLIRELRDSGYHGSDLVGFVSQLMQTVTEKAFEEPSDAGPRSDVGGAGPGSPVPRASRCIEGASIAGSLAVLRRPVPGDRQSIERWLTEPMVQNSLAPLLLETVLESFETRAQPDRIDLMVCHSDSNDPIGIVSLHHIDPIIGQAEIAKVIGDPLFRGKGLAAAATSRLLAHGFDVLGLNRIYLRTLGGNLSNLKLNERMGFRFEGVLREACVRGGGHRDVVLMALLRRDFGQPLPS